MYNIKVSCVKNNLKAKAFTLVELIMVVIILGIIAGMAMMMYNPNESLQLAETGSYLASVIEYAREEAIRRQCITYVCFTSSSDRIHAAYNDGSWKYLTHPLDGGDFTEYLSDVLNNQCDIAAVYASAYHQNYLFFNSFGEPISWYYTTDSSVTYPPIPSGNYIYLTCGSEYLFLRIRPITGKVITFK